MKLASRRGLIGAAGVFSVIAGAVIGTWWLQLHRMYWKGQFECSASVDVLLWSRHSLTSMAIGAGIVAIVALARIATSRSAPGGRLSSVFWVASATLWMTLAVMAFTSVEVRLCQRGLGY